MVAKVGLRQVVDFINRERVKQNLTQNQLAELAGLDSDLLT